MKSLSYAIFAEKNVHINTNVIVSYSNWLNNNSKQNDGEQENR